jgi:hypothetical protein
VLRKLGLAKLNCKLPGTQDISKAFIYVIHFESDWIRAIIDRAPLRGGGGKGAKKKQASKDIVDLPISARQAMDDYDSGTLFRRQGKDGLWYVVKPSKPQWRQS